MMTRLTWAGCLGLMLWGAGLGCRPSGPTVPSPADDQAAAATNLQIFQVQGVVREVDPDRHRVRIAHEEIPDYMVAMTMWFDVKDPQELTGLQPGDGVGFRMLVTEEDGWIDQIQKTGQTNAIVTDVPSGFRLVKDVDPVEEGDPMPAYTLTNELEQVVRLHECKGQAVAFTFFFTRCPYPDFCPRMSRNMADTCQLLQTNAQAPDNWRLFSITIDPEFDTPMVLKYYAMGYQADPERWRFLTGSLMDITALGEQVGLQFYRPDPSQPGSLSHNLRTVVVDAAGKIHRILVGNEWKPEELAAAIMEAAQVPPGS